VNDQTGVNLDDQPSEAAPRAGQPNSVFPTCQASRWGCPAAAVEGSMRLPAAAPNPASSPRREIGKIRLAMRLMRTIFNASCPVAKGAAVDWRRLDAKG